MTREEAAPTDEPADDPREEMTFRVPTGQDMFGNPTDWILVADPELASMYDERAWRSQP